MSLSYEDLQKALDILEIVSKASAEDIKKKYQKLSKEYHPDMQNGNDEKFRELNEAYKIVQKYMKNYRFSFSEDEFKEQYHAFSNDLWYC